MAIKKTGSLVDALKSRQYNSSRLRVGFIDSATYPDGQNVATVAFWNEYGTKIAPPRPFMRTAINDHRAEWIETLKQAVAKYGADKAMLQLGEVIKGDIVFNILNWQDPPNAQYTIDKKGFNKPLIQSAQMSRSITYELERDS